LSFLQARFLIPPSGPLRGRVFGHASSPPSACHTVVQRSRSSAAVSSYASRSRMFFYFRCLSLPSFRPTFRVPLRAGAPLLPVAVFPEEGVIFSEALSFPSTRRLPLPSCPFPSGLRVFLRRCRVGSQRFVASLFELYLVRPRWDHLAVKRLSPVCARLEDCPPRFFCFFSF